MIEVLLFLSGLFVGLFFLKYDFRLESTNAFGLPPGESPDWYKEFLDELNKGIFDE